MYILELAQNFKGQKMLLAIRLIVCFSAFTVATHLFSEISLKEPQFSGFVNFWDSYKKYNKANTNEADNQYDSELQELVEIQNHLQMTKTDNLREAYKKGEQQFSQAIARANASKKTILLLNYARFLKEWADQTPNPESKRSLLTKALSTSEAFLQTYPGDPKYADALYMRAKLVSSLFGFEKSIPHFTKLTQVIPTRANWTSVASGKLILGDYYFETEQPRKALPLFESVNKLFRLFKDADKTNNQYSLSISHRLIWAYYRIGNFSNLLGTLDDIVMEARFLQELDFAEKVLFDTYLLVSEALFQTRDNTSLNMILQNSKLGEHRAHILYNLTELYVAEGSFKPVLRFVDLSLQHFPYFIKNPDILNTAADASKKLDRDLSAEKYLEMLANYHLKTSIWQLKNKAKTTDLQRGIDLSRQAAISLSATYYERGLSTLEPSFFKKSKVLLDMLISENPDHPYLLDWKTRSAHSLFFAEMHMEAIKHYEDILEIQTVSPAQRQILHYQVVRGHEEGWKKQFKEASEKGEPPYESPKVIQSYNLLEKATKDYTAVLGDSNKSAEVILIAANAAKDMTKLERAIDQYKQSLLVTNSANLRTLAMRGLIHAYQLSDDPLTAQSDIYHLAKLEDWKRYQRSFYQEVLNKLSDFTNAAVAKLREDQLNRKAGDMLLAVAKQFKSIPKRGDKISRAAIIYALVGDWNKSTHVAKYYLADTSLKKQRPEMTLFLGKSLENQLFLQDSAKQYLAYARSYPNSRQKIEALNKAYALSTSNMNHKIAFESASLLARASSDLADAFQWDERAFYALSQLMEFKKAKSFAEQGLRRSENTEFKIKYRFLVAEAMQLSGQESQALPVYDGIIDASRSNRSRLGGTLSKTLEAKARLHSAKIIAGDFFERDIFRSEGIDENILEQKVALFERFSNHLQIAIQLEQDPYTSEARLAFARSTNRLANDLMASTKKSNTITERAKRVRRSQSTRLKALAKRTLAGNLKDLDLAFYTGDSAKAEAKAAFGISNQSDKFIIPAPRTTELPNQWSH